MRRPEPHRPLAGGRLPRAFAPRRILPALAALLLAAAALAQVTFDVHLGTSRTPPTTLRVHQAGHPDVTVTDVRYETRAWLPGSNLMNMTQNYYAVRVGWLPGPARAGRVDAGVELELLHDKIYYAGGNDPAAAVQHLEASDGLNYLLVNGVARLPLELSDAYPDGRTQLLARAGFGPVVSAPVSTIRGRPKGHELQGTFRGYEFSGMGLQAAVQARRYLVPWLALSAEGKYTYSRPRMRIDGGTVVTSVPTFHVNLGVTFALPR